MSEPNWLIKWLIPSEVIKYEDWLFGEVDAKVKLVDEKIEAEDSVEEIEKAIDEAWEMIATAEVYLENNK